MPSIGLLALGGWVAQMNTERARIYDCASGVKAGTVISPGTRPRWLGSYLTLSVYKKYEMVKRQLKLPNQR